MKYSLTYLTPSTAAWLQENLDKDKVYREFLDSLRSFLRNGPSGIAEYDDVRATAIQLSSAGVVGELKLGDVSEIIRHVDTPRSKAFLEGLPSRYRMPIKSFAAYLKQQNDHGAMAVQTKVSSKRSGPAEEPTPMLGSESDIRAFLQNRNI